jgi:hypothetical protein
MAAQVRFHISRALPKTAVLVAPRDIISVTTNISIVIKGKSSISLRLVRSKWTHEYDPTVQDSYSVTRVVDGRNYHLDLTG